MFYLPFYHYQKQNHSHGEHFENAHCHCFGGFNLKFNQTFVEFVLLGGIEHVPLRYTFSLRVVRAFPFFKSTTCTLIRSETTSGQEGNFENAHYDCSGGFNSALVMLARIAHVHLLSLAKLGWPALTVPPTSSQCNASHLDSTTTSVTLQIQIRLLLQKCPTLIKSSS
jgi:hypothetical protein